MKKSVIIGIILGIIILGIAIFFLAGPSKPNLQEMCERESWPQEGCSVIFDIKDKELCEKCKELIGEEKFMLMIKEEMEIIEPATANVVHKPVKNLRQGWDQEKIYQHDLIFNVGIIKDGAGNILVLTRGNNKILKVSKDGKFSEYLDVSNLPMIRAIAYQQGKDRLLILEHSLYAYSDGNLEMINQIRESIEVIEINEEDDTFYGCSYMGDIYHYNADGRLIETVAEDLEGCYQMALDEANSKLYYSETFAGTISELDLTDNSKKVIASGMGIPGTFEPISIAFDSKNDLYSFPGPNGLFKYESGSFNKVVDSIAGAGRILWSDSHSAFLQTNDAGANIIAYSPYTKQAEHLTQYANAFAISETEDGTVLICDGDYFDGIQKVDSSGFSKYADIDGHCQALELAGGEIYAGTSQGRIIKISNGEVISEFDNTVTSLSFDSKNNAMVAVIGDRDANSAEIWKIPLDEPESKVKVVELKEVIVERTIPKATVDKEGNIYFIERGQNVIYKIVDGKPIIFITNVLRNDAVTVPGIEYISKENALLVSGINHYDIWPLDNPVKLNFAENTVAPDNFGINENKEGDIVAIHSGEVFKFVYS